MSTKPADPVDEFADSLRMKPGFVRRDDPPPLRDAHVDTPPLKEPCTRLTRPARWAIMAVLLVSAFICGGALTGNAYEPDPQTVYVQVQVTASPNPTVTKVESLPVSCLRAIDDARRVIAQASSVASATDKQLDLLSRAYQAVLLGDTQKMNAASEGIRALDAQISHDKVAVMIPYQQIMDGLSTCPAN